MTYIVTYNQDIIDVDVLSTANNVEYSSNNVRQSNANNY